MQKAPWSKDSSVGERQLQELGTGPVQGALTEYFNNTGLARSLRLSVILSWQKCYSASMQLTSMPEAMQSQLSSPVQEAHMRGYVERCSAISRLFSVGKSVEGRDLWALEISSRPGLEQAKPSFKYVANMHGDEPSGRCPLHPQPALENLLQLPSLQTNLLACM